MGKSALERSPVFFQFLDAVHHILASSPRAFEFNERYLRIINKGYHSRCFSNFLGDYPKERAAASRAVHWVSGGLRCPTLWEYLSAFIPRHTLLNPLYDPTAANGMSHLEPCLDARAYTLWREHFFRNLPQLSHTRHELSEVAVLRKMLARMQQAQHTTDRDADAHTTTAPSKLQGQVDVDVQLKDVAALSVKDRDSSSTATAASAMATDVIN